MQQLPLFLDLASKSCLIVGGGRIAARKARLLLRAGAGVTIVAPAISEEIAAFDDDRLAIVKAAFEPTMCQGHHLIIAATNLRHVNRQVSGAANHFGIWCNAVDDADLSTAFFPAIVDRSPVTIAVGTGGTSPSLARQIKKQIEAILPSRLGQLARQLGHWRDQVKLARTNPDARKRFWEHVLSGPIARHLLAGRQQEAEQAFQRELNAPGGYSSPGEAYLVGAGPGDAGLLTLHGHQLLAQADVVLYDSLISEEILDFARKDANRVCVGKRPGESYKQAEISRMLVRLVKKGYRVCRLKGGDPFVFGRGGEEAEALAKAGLPFQVVPGITAALGCAASAGIPLTLRGVSSSLRLATAISKGASDPDWQLLAQPGQTLALYMSLGSLNRVVSQLIAHGMPCSTPAAVVENGTKTNQRVLEAELGQIAQVCAEHEAKPPAILFVGEVVAMRICVETQTLWNNMGYLLYPNVLSA